MVIEFGKSFISRQVITHVFHWLFRNHIKLEFKHEYSSYNIGYSSFWVQV